MDRVDLVPPTRHGACSVHRTARADVDRRPVAAVRDTGRREGNPCTSLGPASGWVIIRQTYCVTERMPIWLSPAGRTLVVVATRNEGREKKNGGLKLCMGARKVPGPGGIKSVEIVCHAFAPLFVCSSAVIRRCRWIVDCLSPAPSTDCRVSIG